MNFLESYFIGRLLTSSPSLIDRLPPTFENFFHDDRWTSLGKSEIGWRVFPLQNLKILCFAPLFLGCTASKTIWHDFAVVSTILHNFLKTKPKLRSKRCRAKFSENWVREYLSNLLCANHFASRSSLMGWLAPKIDKFYFCDPPSNWL